MSKIALREHQRVSPTLSYKRAGLLDVPLIFDLIQGGAEAGSFGDAFVERTGSLKLFGYVLRGVSAQYFPFPSKKDRPNWKMICQLNGTTVGFFCLTKSSRQGDWFLDFLAICPDNRNQGIGSIALEQVISDLPAGSQLVVHCTAFARAMQHILKRHKFRRNVNFNVPRLEEYRLDLAGPTPK